MANPSGWEYLELLKTIEGKYSEEEVTRKAWEGEKADILAALIAIVKALQPPATESGQSTPTRAS